MANFWAETSPSFRQYIKLALALHQLEMYGLFESTTADAIRDDMDQPWHGMKECERDRAREFQASLNCIAGKQDECQPQSNVAVSGTGESLDNHK